MLGVRTSSLHGFTSWHYQEPLLFTLHTVGVECWNHLSTWLYLVINSAYFFTIHPCHLRNILFSTTLNIIMLQLITLFYLFGWSSSHCYEVIFPTTTITKSNSIHTNNFYTIFKRRKQNTTFKSTRFNTVLHLSKSRTLHYILQLLQYGVEKFMKTFPTCENLI